MMISCQVENIKQQQMSSLTPFVLLTLISVTSACPAGHWCVPSGITFPCPPNYFSKTDEMHCTPCPAGTYTAHNNQTACITCPPGKFGVNPGLGCIDCLPMYSADCPTHHPNKIEPYVLLFLFCLLIIFLVDYAEKHHKDKKRK